MHELPHKHLPRHDWRVFVGYLRGLHCWELLRNDGTLGRHCHLRPWTVFVDLCIRVHELRCGSISSNRRFHELHELLCWHIPRHDRRVVVDNLRSLYCRELLRHDRAFSGHGNLCRWAVFDFLGFSVHQLLSWSISSERCLDELHELSHRHLSRNNWRVVVGNLRILQCWKLLWHDWSVDRLGGVFGWLLFDCLGVHLFIVRLGLLPGGSRVVKLFDMCRGQLLGSSVKRVLELRCGHV